MRVIIEARALQTYPLGKPGFRGGTETMVAVLAAGLAAKGHIVHVVTHDLEREEQRGPREFWWTREVFPTKAGCVVAVHNLAHIDPYDAAILVLASNGIDGWMGPGGERAAQVDGFPVFSQCHADLMIGRNPKIDRERVYVTGLGHDPKEYGDAEPSLRRLTPGRMFYGNDPQRGLWHVLDIFDAVKRRVSYASLAITYDFGRQFEAHRWQSNQMAETLWECKRRIEATPGILNLGALERYKLVFEQLACQVHAMPSDPPNVGSQIHGLTQLECAAAGAALVLSDTEAFPEVFGKAAEILPVPGTFLPKYERRYDAEDWAEVVVRLMTDEKVWTAASKKARRFAKKHTWGAVIDRWQAMLTALAERVTGNEKEAA